jgi:hypothetical protein
MGIYKKKLSFVMEKYRIFTRFSLNGVLLNFLKKVMKTKVLLLVVCSFAAQLVFAQINSNSPTVPFGSRSSYPNGIMQRIYLPVEPMVNRKLLPMHIMRSKQIY